MIQPFTQPEYTGQSPFGATPDGTAPSPEADRAHPEFFIRQTFAHDPQAGCSLLFRRYYAPLCNHVVKLVYSRQVAEDIVAEVFCAFWRKKVYEKITVSYQAYLYASVRHRAVDYLRKELGGRRTVSCDDIEYTDQLPEPDQLMQYEELYQKVEVAIAGLPGQCQKVFVMSRFEGKKYHEIAAELSLSMKTVEAHMTRALAMLRKSILLLVAVIFCL